MQNESSDWTNELLALNVKSIEMREHGECEKRCAMRLKLINHAWSYTDEAYERISKLMIINNK
jgi:hypothetical protein